MQIISIFLDAQELVTNTLLNMELLNYLTKLKLFIITIPFLMFLYLPKDLLEYLLKPITIKKMILLLTNGVLLLLELKTKHVPTKTYQIPVSKITYIIQEFIQDVLMLKLCLIMYIELLLNIPHSILYKDSLLYNHSMMKSKMLNNKNNNTNQMLYSDFDKILLYDLVFTL